MVSAGVSSSVRIGARREGELGCKGTRFDHKASVAEDGLEAGRARQGGRRATRGGQGGRIMEGVTWSNSARFRGPRHANISYSIITESPTRGTTKFR